MSFGNVSHNLSVCLRGPEVMKSLKVWTVSQLKLYTSVLLVGCINHEKLQSKLTVFKVLLTTSEAVHVRCSFMLTAGNVMLIQLIWLKENPEITRWIYHSHRTHIKTWSKGFAFCQICVSSIISIGLFSDYIQIGFENHVFGWNMLSAGK